jgi:cholecystokinin A receptor/hypocretin (orexin) receptor 2
VQVTSTIFILALAWTDIFTCSVNIPLTIILVANDNDLFCDFLCKFYHFCITFNVPLAALIMVAIGRFEPSSKPGQS